MKSRDWRKSKIRIENKRHTNSHQPLTSPSTTEATIPSSSPELSISLFPITAATHEWRAAVQANIIVCVLCQPGVFVRKEAGFFLPKQRMQWSGHSEG